MILKTNSTNFCRQAMNLSKGFTIVELLVVIVVIGILASITIVSYTGVTAKANTSAGKSAANSVVGKAQLYAAEPTTTNKYPLTLALLTGAASTTTYKLTGVTYAAMGTTTSSAIPPASPTAPAANNGVIYVVCGVRAAGNNTAPAQYSDIANPTGIKVYYWDYTGTPAITTAPDTAGTLSGTLGTQTIGCFASGS